MREAFTWAHKVCMVCRQNFSDSTLHRSLLCQSPGTDSEFSGGAGGWEVAALCLETAFRAKGVPASLGPLATCDTRIQVSQYFFDLALTGNTFCVQTSCRSSSQEIDANMREMLAPRLHPHTHMFTNVLDIFGDGHAVHSCFMSEPDYSSKLALAFSNELPRHHSAWCEAHGQHCDMRTGCSVRVGGTPCQDWSNAGLCMGLDGPQLPCLLGFGAKSICTDTPLAVVECVCRLPTEIVQDAFGGSLFSWPIAAHLCPNEVGFGCTNRPRRVLNSVKLFSNISN